MALVATLAFTPVSTSQNWAGYVATGATFTGVTGTWTVPQPSSTMATAGVGATWVGIGGLDSRDLIQAGTQDVTSSGQHHFQTWLEVLPASAQQLPVAVAPGDSVTVSILEQGASGSGIWQVSFMNNSSGEHFAITISYPSSESSSEWIEEAPSARGDILPLDTFGSVAFSNDMTVVNGENADLSEADAQPITLVNSDEQALAVPSPIGGDGLGFSITRTSAPSILTSRVLALTLP